MRKLAIFSGAFALSLLLAAYVLPESLQLPAAAIFAAAGGLSLLLRGGVRLRACIAAFGLAAGMLGFFAAWRISYLPAAALDGQEGTYAATASGFSEKTDYGAKCDIRLKAGKRSIKARLFIRGDAPELTPGDGLRFYGELRAADEMYGAETDAFVERGCFLLAYADGAEVTEDRGFSLRYAPKYAARAVCARISDIFTEDVRPFMLALLAGERGELYSDAGLLDALNTSGVRHIVVVSGMHLAYLVEIVALLFGRRRRVTLIAAPVLLGFAAMTGFSPSVVRACVMQLFLMAAPVFNREGDALTSLSAALLLLLAVNPYSVTDLGLQLTFGATLGIVLFTGRVYSSLDALFKGSRAYKRKPVKKLIRFALANLATTIGASAFTIPLVAVRLNYVSIIAPVTNLAVSWAVAIAFFLGLAAVAAGLIFIPAGSVIAYIARLPAKYTVLAVEWLGGARFASVYTVNAVVVYWLVYAALALLLFFIFKRGAKRVLPVVCLASISLCAVLLLTYLSSGRGGMSFTVLDVGQGQCIVVTSGAATAVIDCGSSSGKDAGALAAQYVRSLGRKRIDIFILTHYHADHANGADELLETMDVGLLIAPEPAAEDDYLAEDLAELAREHEIDVLYVRERATASLGDSKLELYPPFGSDSTNERGICAVCTCGKFDALVTGDIPASMERRLIHTYSLPDTEVLVVGHHGSAYSSCAELLSAVTPETAVISVGYNTYGHPSEETVSRLRAAGMAVYRTDLAGNITINSGDNQNG